MHRAEVADRRVAPLRVVEKFNVVEHVGAGLIAGSVDLACRAFGFQRREEACHGGIVPDVPRAAHAAGDTVIGHELLKLLAGLLAALVGMVQQGIWLATAPDRHHERVGDQLGGHRSAHRPAHHPA